MRRGAFIRRLKLDTGVDNSTRPARRDGKEGKAVNRSKRTAAAAVNRRELCWSRPMVVNQQQHDASTRCNQARQATSNQTSPKTGRSSIQPASAIAFGADRVQPARRPWSAALDPVGARRNRASATFFASSPNLGPPEAEQTQTLSIFATTWRAFRKRVSSVSEHRACSLLTITRPSWRCQKLHHAHSRREEAADFTPRLPSSLHLQGNLPP